MTITPGASMLTRPLEIEMTAGGLGGDPFAVLLRRVAAAVLMHVETVQARFQGLQCRGKQQSIPGFADLAMAEFLLLPLGIHQLNGRQLRRSPRVNRRQP